MALAVLIPWLLAGALLAVAAVALARVRAAAADAAGQRSELSALRAALAAASERLAASETKRHRAGEELSEQRHKLDKAKKRAARSDRNPRDSAAAHATDPGKELEATRQARDAANAEARRLADEVARLEAALRRQAADTPLLSNPAIEALQRRAAELDAGRARLQADLDAARQDAAKLRQKTKTQEQLYLSIRGDLEAKKDRLRTQTEEVERLRALEVVLNHGPD